MPVNKKYLKNEKGRQCSYCEIFKSWSEFGKCKGKTYGHKSKCKECIRKLNGKSIGRTSCAIDEFGRECPVCGRYKQWDEFGKYKKGVNGHRSQCKQCFAIMQKKYRSGLTKDAYLDLLRKASNKCQICEQERFLVIDHCHQTKRVRGLLCHNCNKAIGLVNDSVMLLHRMIRYLESNFSLKPNTNREYPKQSKEIDLFRRYGITEQEYSYMYKAQCGKCAICTSENSSNGRLAVDHNHKTGMIKGLLCTYCNSAIGQFNDSIKNIKKSIEYLERS